MKKETLEEMVQFVPYVYYTKGMKKLDEDYMEERLDLAKAVEVWGHLFKRVKEVGLYNRYVSITVYESVNEVNVELALNESMNELFNIDDHPFRFTQFKDFITFLNEVYHEDIFEEYYRELFKWLSEEKPKELLKSDDDKVDYLSKKLQIETMQSLIDEIKREEIDFVRVLTKKMNYMIESFCNKYGRK